MIGCFPVTRSKRRGIVIGAFALSCWLMSTSGRVDAESITANDISTYGQFSLSPVDEVVFIGAVSTNDESPLDHYERAGFGAWPVDEAAADDATVRLEIATTEGPLILELKFLVDGQSFRSAADRVIAGEGAAADVPAETKTASVENGPAIDAPTENPESEAAAKSDDGSAKAIPRVSAQRYERGSADERLRAFVASQSDPTSIERDELNWLLNNWRPGPPVFVASKRFTTSAGSEVSLWARIDSNRDGEISNAEIEAIDARVREADANRDRVITADELGEVSLIALRAANLGVLTKDAPEAKVMGLEVRVDAGVMTVASNDSNGTAGGTLELEHGQTTIEVMAAADKRTSSSMLAKSQFSVASQPVGNPLMVACEQYRDGRLDESEQKQLSQRVAELDRDRDGRVVPSEVPRRIRLFISQGPWAAAALKQLGERPTTTQTTEPKAAMAAAPDWFRGMDTNNDRFLSSREFLGERDSFDDMDIDGDELISAEEAIAASEDN